MKIKNYKRKCLAGCLILIFAGAVIALSGFAMTGFSAEPIKEANGHRMYQTVYVQNERLAFGVQLSESHTVLKIGGDPFIFAFFNHY